MSESQSIAILGAGSWGLTLAYLLGGKGTGKTIRVWSRDAEKAKNLQTLRKMEKPLAIGIPAGVVVTSDLAQCLDQAEMVLFCTTSQSLRSVAVQALSHLKVAVPASGQGAQKGAAKQSGPILVSAAKGIELKTFKRMSEILEEVMPQLPACALSGPNLAQEVLAGLPTASVVASSDQAVAKRVQEALSLPAFRVYTNSDLVGVELGGALKNIIAIAAGAVDGLQLGTNAKAALMTRGLAEMTRIAVALGASPSTLSGLAGMGDLVATCYSSLSRNYRLGYEMARGSSAADAERKLGAIAEGITTAQAVCEFSKTRGIAVPIAEQVAATLSGQTTPAKAIMALMSRPLSSEDK